MHRFPQERWIKKSITVNGNPSPFPRILDTVRHYSSEIRRMREFPRCSPPPQSLWVVLFDILRNASISPPNTQSIKKVQKSKIIQDVHTDNLLNDSYIVCGLEVQSQYRKCCADKFCVARASKHRNHRRNDLNEAQSLTIETTVLGR